MNIALLLAAGAGTRAESRIPKQYHRANRKMMLRFAFESLTETGLFDCVIICAHDSWAHIISKEIANSNFDKPVVFSQQGATAQFSILNALKSFNDLIGIGEADKIVIHEACRPYATKEIAIACLDKCKDGIEGVIPVIPTDDAIIIAHDLPCKIDKMLNRRRTFIPQMPQCYNMSAYYNAHFQLTHQEIGRITDPCQLAYAAGMNLQLISGEEANRKIITYGDLYHFKYVNMPGKGINPPPMEILQ